MLYKGKDVELSFAGAKVLPINAPSFVAYENFKQQYGEDGTVLVVGLQSEKIFEQAFLNDWQKLSNDLKKITGITNVLSISHAFNLKKDTSKSQFVVEQIMTAPVKNQMAADSIQQKFYSLPFYEGLLINKKTNATLIAVNFSKETLNTSKRAGVLKEIVALTTAFEAKHQVKLHLSGLPYIRTVVSNKIAGEFKLFLALAVLITAVILL